VDELTKTVIHRWWGKVWFYHNQLKYEFDLEFDVRIHNPFRLEEPSLIVSFNDRLLPYVADSCYVSHHIA